MTNSKKINKENLDYRDVKNHRSIKPQEEKLGPSYFEAVRTGEGWKKAIQYRMKWAKDNQTIYSLPLNTINEAHLSTI